MHNAFVTFDNVDSFDEVVDDFDDTDDAVGTVLVVPVVQWLEKAGDTWRRSCLGSWSAWGSKTF